MKFLRLLTQYLSIGYLCNLLGLPHKDKCWVSNLVDIICLKPG